MKFFNGLKCRFPHLKKRVMILSESSLELDKRGKKTTFLAILFKKLGQKVAQEYKLNVLWMGKSMLKEKSIKNRAMRSLQEKNPGLPRVHSSLL